MPENLSLSDGFRRSGLSSHELWVSYVAVGGTMTSSQVHQALDDRAIPAREHDLIAQAINDWFTSRGQNHPVAYRGMRDIAASGAPPRIADVESAGSEGGS